MIVPLAILIKVETTLEFSITTRNQSAGGRLIFVSRHSCSKQSTAKQTSLKAL